MQQCTLLIARLAISAWVGAAVLFVVVGVNEVIHPGFDTTVRDQLVLIRFPWFYCFGFSLLIVGWCGTLLTPPRGELTSRRKRVVSGLLLLALLLMALDFFAVYDPLVGMITPPGSTRPPEFTAYHRASMWVNLTQLLCSFAAAGLLNWPVTRSGE